MIKFKNVTATYNNGSGIFDINFEVKKSELVFLMGPTGSGRLIRVNYMLIKLKFQI